MSNSKKTQISDLLERDKETISTGNTEEVIENENTYTLRKLTSKDISPMIKILKKIDMEELKKSIANISFSELMQANKETDGETENNVDYLEIGKDLIFDLIPVLLDALDNALPEFNKLLASVAGVEVEEIENLDLNVYFNLIYEFIKKDEFKGFLKVASKFLNSGN